MEGTISTRIYIGNVTMFIERENREYLDDNPIITIKIVQEENDDERNSVEFSLDQDELKDLISTLNIIDKGL